MKSWQTEAFEKLGPCKDFPITHYFDSHAQLFAQVSAKAANKDHHGKVWSIIIDNDEVLHIMLN